MSAKVNNFLGQDQQGQHFVGQGQYIRQIYQKPCRSKSILVNIGIRTSSKRKKICRARSIMPFGAKICRAKSIRTVGQGQLYKLGQDQWSRLGQMHWVPFMLTSLN